MGHPAAAPLGSWRYTRRFHVSKRPDETGPPDSRGRLSPHELGRFPKWEWSEIYLALSVPFGHWGVAF